MVKLFYFRESDIDLRLMRLFMLGDHLRQAMKCLRTKNNIDVRCAGKDLFALLARHTAPHSNHHVVFAGFFFSFSHTPQVRKNFFLSLFSNGACIKHHEICFVHILGPLITFFSQKVGDLFRVIVIHLAAEAAKV